MKIVKMSRISDLADCPEVTQTSPSRYTPRYLRTEILFTGIDIAYHADSTGCNGNSNDGSNDNVTFVRRSSFVVHRSEAIYRALCVASDRSCRATLCNFGRRRRS